MSLPEEIRKSISDYCIRDLPGNLEWHVAQFSFINDNELKSYLGRAYYSARYIAKLMEALYVSGDERYPFIKFQLIQYASIYEAVITNLLWNNFASHLEVIKLQTHKAYKPVAAFGSLATMKFEDEIIFPCVYRDSKTPKNSIPFRDKVDCGIRIGFVDPAYSEEIKSIYALRNLIHIESEAKKQIELEIDQSKNAYWRITPFLERISKFLETSTVSFELIS
jgi:hypothetical protein